MKPKLKPPGIKRLKLKSNLRLSTSAFEFNLRRYTGVAGHLLHAPCQLTARVWASSRAQ